MQKVLKSLQEKWKIFNEDISNRHVWHGISLFNKHNYSCIMYRILETFPREYTERFESINYQEANTFQWLSKNEKMDSFIFSTSFMISFSRRARAFKLMADEKSRLKYISFVMCHRVWHQNMEIEITKSCRSSFCN